MDFFADRAEQPTPGDRGQTTRRRGTRTVRGPEGAWIAQMKEELAARTEVVAVVEYRVFHESVWADGTKAAAFSHTMATRAEAEAYAARRLALNGTPEANGWTCTLARVEEVLGTRKIIREA